MIRRTRAALLILALLCQSLLWLTPLGQAHISTKMTHAWAHAHDAAHHHGHEQEHLHNYDHDHDHDHEQGHDHRLAQGLHHNDPSLQLDEPGSDAAHHHHHHEAAQPMGLVPHGDGTGFDSLRAIRFLRFAPPIAAVFLQTPLRPPQRALA